MTSYSSILRKNKPLDALSRGLKKDGGFQNGVLIEKIYCDRNKGRKSSNIRLVDSSSATNPKTGLESTVTNSINSDLSEKANTNQEYVETRNPKILQTLETTHTFVTNSGVSYYLQTKKETQSIIDDLEEFPALGANRPTKRVGDATQISQLSPYAKPFVFTGAFEDNTIYNAYSYYDYNDGSDEYDDGTYEVDYYNNPNGNIEESWDGMDQVETKAPDVEYEIADKNDDPNNGSISLSRKKYLSKLSVDAKPFELKKNVTNKDIYEQPNSEDSSIDAKSFKLKKNGSKTDTSEQHNSEDSAVPSLRPSYRSISVDSSPFVPRNSFQQNIRSDNHLFDDKYKKNVEKSISTDDKTKRYPFKSHFDEQSRNFRFNREAVFSTCEDMKYESPVYKSPSARINLSKDIPTESISLHKNSESREGNLSVDAKHFNIKKMSRNNSVSSDGIEKSIQDEDSYNKKKFPLMPLPSNASKSAVSQNIKLRPDAQPFNTKSKIEKQIDELENQNPNSKIHYRNYSPTKNNACSMNGSQSSRPLKPPSTQNDYKQVKISSTAKTSNRTSDNIVSWRRGALSNLILNSSDAASNKNINEAKNLNQVSPTNRRSFLPRESNSMRNYKLSHETNSIKHANERQTVNNKNYNNSYTKSNYNNSSHTSYVQPWSNGTESPNSPSNSNGSQGQMSNDNSSNDDEDSKAEISRYEKTSFFTSKDSETKVGVQYKDHFKRDTISNVDPKLSNTYTENWENSEQLSNCYSPNRSPEPKMSLPFHPLSHGLSDQSPENQQNGFIQQWNNYNQYRHDQSASILPQCSGPRYIHEKIYQTQVPQASFQPPLNVRSIEQANSEVNMSPIHRQVINNQVNSFALHSAENAPVNMNTNFHPQAPGYDSPFWNMRQPYNVPHSDPMLAYRQPANPTAPNSFINPGFPIANRYIGPQMMPHNSMQIAHNPPNRFPNEYINESQPPIQQNMPHGHMSIAHNVSNRFPNGYRNSNLPPVPQFMPRNSIPVSHNLSKCLSNEYRNENQSPVTQMVNHNAMLMPHNLPNRLPNEYRKENQSPVQNTSIIEANLVNNGANKVSPPWPTNYARDFNQFMEMYAQKLTSQMLPIIQDNHLMSTVTQKSLIDVNLNSRETVSSDYLENEHSTKSVPTHPQAFEDHANVLKETFKSAENNFKKLAEPVENPFKNIMNVLQKESPPSLIPPPIPPRRNINSNHSSTTANSLNGKNPFKNNSLSNTFEEKVLIQNEKTATFLHSFQENKINENNSGNNCWSLQDPSPTNVSQNNNVSKNPFLTDFTSASTIEVTEKSECIDLNPFRQHLNESSSDKPRGKNPFLDMEVKNIDTYEATLTNQPIIDLPKDPLWYYRDPQNEVQGPFTSIEMAEWFHSGYFKDEVQIRRNCDKRYVGIGEFLELTGSSSPFLESRSVPPLGLETTIFKKSTNPFSDVWQSNPSQKPCTSKLYNS